MPKMLMVIGMMTKGQSGTDHPLVGADVTSQENVPPELQDDVNISIA